MSKLSHDADSERYKALGFRAQFDGTSAGLPWAELIEELKTNVLRQPLRVRKLIMGEYTTKAGEHELAKVAATPMYLCTFNARLWLVSCDVKRAHPYASAAAVMWV